MPHFIYCGLHHHGSSNNYHPFEEMILEKMETFGIQSLNLTSLFMQRCNLMTNENVKKGYDGKFEGIYYMGKSMNDDLEEYLINIQNGEFKTEEISDIFFTPKLTNEELRLVEQGNKKHMMSYFEYYEGRNADVEIEEMKRSNSKSKYVLCVGKRIPLSLTVEKPRDSLYDTIYTIQNNGWRDHSRLGVF